MKKPCLISQRIQHVSTEVSMNIRCQYFILPKIYTIKLEWWQRIKRRKIGQYVTCTLLRTIYYFDYKQLIPEQLGTNYCLSVQPVNLSILVDNNKPNLLICNEHHLLSYHRSPRNVPIFSRSYSLQLPKMEAGIRFFHEIYYICYRLHSISVQKTVLFSR